MLYILLFQQFPHLRYLIIGDAGPAGDWGERLKRQVADLGLQEHVLFLGFCAPEHLYVRYAAADVFVLATRSEGWANVFLEAMACGLPVVTTDVGGNAEVVCQPELGMLVPFGQPEALRQALADSLERGWDRSAIIRYAQDNNWDDRVNILLEVFDRLVGQ